MSCRSPKQVHIEATVGLFKVLDADILSVDMVAATYPIPRDFVHDTMERAVQLGFLGEVDDGAYQLTPRGERLLEEIILRC